jgi:hypothetical protein
MYALPFTAYSIYITLFFINIDINIIKVFTAIYK